MTSTIPTPSTTPSGTRTLRRSREGRVAAGVSAGLGRYFAVDPVLFRVLFATSAFFGGAGILAYLLAWAAIPDDGTEHAAVDGWVAALRRRRVPVWLVAITGGLLFWAVAASWWAPGPSLPVIAVAVIAVVALLSRRRARSAQEAPTVVLDKQQHATTPPSEMRAWVQESTAARRLRVRRAMPLRVGALVTLTVVLTVLALVDAARGVEVQAYFWTTLGIVLLTLLVGVVLRRTPWSLAVLLVPAVAGAVAFGGSAARLHDGVGERTWTPTTGSTHYRLAAGKVELDLRALRGPARIDVTVGAGDVRIVAPRTAALTVDARVHIGRVEVDPRPGTHDDQADGGVGVHRVVGPLTGATGAPVTVHVELAEGRVLVEHR